MENLEAIRPTTRDGSAGRFPLCFGCNDSFDPIEHHSIQMARRSESRSVQSCDSSFEEVVVLPA